MSIFLDLCNFFGISAEAPTTLGELFPWLMQIAVAVGLVAYILHWIFSVTKFASRGRW